MLQNDTLEGTLATELQRGQRYGFPVSVALLSIQSQPEEDGAIRFIRQTRRSSDLVFEIEPRLLAVVLPHTPEAGALGYAQRVIRGLAQSQVTAHCQAATDPGCNKGPTKLLAEAFVALDKALTLAP